MITKEKLLTIVPSAANAKIDLDLFVSIVNEAFPDNDRSGNVKLDER